VQVLEIRKKASKQHRIAVSKDDSQSEAIVAYLQPSSLQNSCFVFSCLDPKERVKWQAIPTAKLSVHVPVTEIQERQCAGCGANVFEVVGTSASTVEPRVIHQNKVKKLGMTISDVPGEFVAEQKKKTSQQLKEMLGTRQVYFAKSWSKDNLIIALYRNSVSQATT
jgi:hypothetical protein